MSPVSHGPQLASTSSSVDVVGDAYQASSLATHEDTIGTPLANIPLRMSWEGRSTITSLSYVG